MNEYAVRKAFERRARSYGWNVTRFCGGAYYEDENTQRAWISWRDSNVGEVPQKRIDTALEYVDIMEHGDEHTEYTQEHLIRIVRQILKGEYNESVQN